MKLVVCLSERHDFQEAQQAGTEVAEKLGGKLAYVLLPSHSLDKLTRITGQPGFFAASPPPVHGLDLLSFRWWHCAHWLTRAMLAKGVKADTVAVCQNIAQLRELPLRRPRLNEIIASYGNSCSVIDADRWIAHPSSFMRAACFWKFMQHLERAHLPMLPPDDQPRQQRNHVWAFWLLSQRFELERL